MLNQARSQVSKPGTPIRLAARWQSTELGIPLAGPLQALPDSFKLLLLGDGSTTRNLELLTGASVSIELLAMQAVAATDEFLPQLIQQIRAPWLSREVWLHGPAGERLAYAVSWWPQHEVDQFLPDPANPIWTSLADKQRELYRDLKEVVYGDSEELSNVFSEPGPYWGRYYYFWYQGRPLTLIQEIFNPVLLK